MKLGLNQGQTRAKVDMVSCCHQNKSNQILKKLLRLLSQWLKNLEKTRTLRLINFNYLNTFLFRDTKKFGFSLSKIQNQIMTRTDPKRDSSSKYVGHPSRLYHVRIIIQSKPLLHFSYSEILKFSTFSKNAI